MSHANPARARVPLAWAMTQNNLGTALRALGERESGTAKLEQAVEAYQAALLERTRARVPLDWAGTILSGCPAGCGLSGVLSAFARSCSAGSSCGWDSGVAEDPDADGGAVGALRTPPRSLP